MPGLIIKGRGIEVPGLKIINFLDEPILKLRPGNDVRRRLSQHWVRNIILHTTKGEWPQTIRTNLGPFMSIGKKVAKYWTTSPENAAAHLVVDWDGTVTCHADLDCDATMHAGACNEFSIGIEIFQGSRPENILYEGQLEKVVLLIDALTLLFGIQRQIPPPDSYRIIPRCGDEGEKGRMVVGCFGHRNCTQLRGRGDPGDIIFQRLMEAKYEVMDFIRRDDIRVWANRQKKYLGMGIDNQYFADGIPGPLTVRQIQKVHEVESGLWITRPIDRVLQIGRVEI